MSENNYILEINNLEKSFGDKKVLKGLNLKVPPKKVFGFVGKKRSRKDHHHEDGTGSYDSRQGRDLRKRRKSELRKHRYEPLHRLPPGCSRVLLFYDSEGISLILRRDHKDG